MDSAPYGPYRQSERGEIYVKLANKLLEEGKAYRCFCTKEELEEMKARQEAEGVPPRYDGTWRDADPELVKQKLEEGAEYTVRFKVPPGARVVIEDAVRGTVSWDAESTVGDFILLRSSGIPVYNFCVAVDDASMGVTTVIRAEEHLTNTLRQGLILDALGAPRPRYAHCSLILGEDKQKLSKRHGATSCNQFRLDGYLPDAMINYLALLGWNDGTDNEIFTREELIEVFDVDRVVKSPSIFDMDKLKWINSQHLKMKSVEELTDLVKEQFHILGYVKEDADEEKLKDFVFAATALAKQMMETTRDAATNAQKVLGYALPESFDKVEDGEAKAMISNGNFYPIAQSLIKKAEAGELPLPDTAEPLAAFLDEHHNVITEDNHTGGSAYSFPEAYKATMKQIAKDLQVKGKNLFHPVRLALTGEMSGQDVTKQLALLSLATEEGSVIDSEKVGVVKFEDRIARLKKFCETIPVEFHAPKGQEEQPRKVERKKEEGTTENTSSGEGASESVTAAADPFDTYDGPPITSLDIRVGIIKRVWEHPEADKLYCEEIDVGEEQPRQIASGLRPYMKAEDMEGRKVLVLCNLKERKMVGFPSHGMVLCASNNDHSEVKFVNPPIDAKVGERVMIPGFDFEGEAGAPMSENPMAKKKVFEKIAPFLVTNKYGIPEFLGRPFMTSAGVCTSSISDGNVA
jgi:glutamyl-tRNA synthetase